MKSLQDRSISSDYLTPQEHALIGGTCNDKHIQFPHRPLLFSKIPVSSEFIADINSARRVTGFYEHTILRSAMQFPDHLLMKLEPLDNLGNTVRDPSFLVATIGENGKVALVEDERLTAVVYGFLEGFKGKEVYRRVEGRNSHQERR